MESKQVEKNVLRRMVIQYHKDGLSVRKIAEKTKTSKSNKKGRIDAIKPPGRSGPSERTLRRLKYQVEKEPFATQKEAANQIDKSVSTVRRYLQKLNSNSSKNIQKKREKNQKQTQIMSQSNTNEDIGSRKNAYIQYKTIKKNCREHPDRLKGWARGGYSRRRDGLV
ncbi:hypothetical protein DERP_013236 [Dermatophagoides pteronyssinus]|uniref:Uncharacterized protein n=1 Tax=Dermatophagoides pteronyssinus TaxID=6956 RepID=A0ABQ8IRH7_DERPT|nr:hypothetical protein DERP_013236 [Dermatophagoides pteronyssinus]